MVIEFSLGELKRDTFGDGEVAMATEAVATPSPLASLSSSESYSSCTTKLF